MLSNHVAVEIDGNVKRFDHEGLRQLQCGQNVLHYYLFQLLRDCSTIAPPPTYAIAMSLYQIKYYHGIGKCVYVDNNGPCLIVGKVTRIILAKFCCLPSDFRYKSCTI